MRTDTGLQTHRISPMLPQAFGAGSTALGLLAFLGWLSGHPLFASFGANLIPMAPSTALLFVVLGIAIFFCSRFPLKRGIQLMGVTLGSLSAVMAFVLFYLSSAHTYSPIEHLGIPITGTLNLSSTV